MKRVGILLVIAVLLWGVVYLWPEKAKESIEIKWPDWSKEEIVNITFNSFELQKRKGSWQVLKENKVFPADNKKIKEFINFISQNKPKRVLDNKLDKIKWAEYGLKEVNKVIIKRGNRADEIILGAENPTKDGVYALVSLGEHKLILLPYEYKRELTKKAKDFYQLKVFDFSDENLKKVNIEKQGKPYLKLVKDSKGFKFVYPQEYQKEKVNTSEATSLFFNLAQLKAQDILYINKLDSLPLYSYHLVLDTLAEFNFSLYPYQKSNYLLKLDKKNWYYLLDQASINEINKSPFLLKDRHFLNFEQDQVKRLILSSQDKVLDIIYKNNVWKKAGTEEEFSGASLYFWELSDLEYLDKKADPGVVDKALLTITLKDKRNKELLEVQFFKEKREGKYWVKSGQGQDFYLVETDLVKNLLNSLKEN